jgi:hypothetical protein
VISLSGSFVGKKLGPLPVWAWMGLGLGGALAISTWRSNKAASEEDETASADDPVIQSYEMPDSIQPTYTFQNYDQDRTYITMPSMPPAGGRPATPVETVPATTTPTTTTPAATSTVKPAAAAPKGVWVTVVKWAKGQKAGTPSTLWGIAEKVYGKGKGGTWTKIWNAPQNAALKKKRGKPELIQPGDKFWVPK